MQAAETNWELPRHACGLFIVAFGCILSALPHELLSHTVPNPTRLESFAEKFRIALDALNWSRVGCARELSVDKSVISRWAGGSTAPTEQNLARFTARLQEVHPRFHAGAWRMDLEAFAALLQPVEHSDASAIPAATGQPSIAVLAFDSLSGDPADRQVGNGMAEDLITELSRSRSWLVVSRNSSFTFKERPVDIRRVGRELGVRYVLEGSIQRSGDRIRVSVQLVEAESRVHVWAERYDRALADLFTMQDDIAQAVVLALEPAVETAERLRLQRKHPDSMDAWEAWQHARSHFDAEEWDRIDPWLHRSIALDPGFAMPHAARAFLLHALAVDGHRPFHATLSEAEEEGRTAIRLSPNEPAGYAALSMCLGATRNLAGSLHNAMQALELGPSNWTAQIALSLALFGARAFDAAAEHIACLHRIGPRGAARRTTLMLGAGLHFLRGDYISAMDAAATLIAAYPAYGHPYRVLLASLGHLGRREEAAAPLARWLAVVPGQVAQLAALGIPWWHPEDSDRAVAGLRAAGWTG